MALIDKILVTIAITGLIGMLLNMILNKDNHDWRNHTYSTILIATAVITLLLYHVWI